MKQTFKVASWEIKRNLKNKSFLISLFLTPALIALFIFIPTVFEDSADEADRIHVMINDELNLFPLFETIVDDYDIDNWKITKTELSSDEVFERLEEEENVVYFSISEDVLEENILTLYTSDNIDYNFFYQANIFTDILKQYQLEQLSLTEEELAIVTQDIAIDLTEVTDESKSEATTDGTIDSNQEEETFLRRLVPGLF